MGEGGRAGPFTASRGQAVKRGARLGSGRVSALVTAGVPCGGGGFEGVCAGCGTVRGARVARMITGPYGSAQDLGERTGTGPGQSVPTLRT
ncbi:hypothetical protein Ppa06_57930 [Planomonospora parontospora subsp. parontospora]|uniref:Uncharacterized protein n=2 Tax=Planomonospora parontospora TaxID=58119 RepID=A0AA37F764_9ACTN|nr:hypothetical protein GCM10010126_57380 [Planomonospora parontospora]GII11995.1 hypothetical protein Ppa06_57930 [Planomonospora parontospora subsp. parontospora]